MSISWKPTRQSGRSATSNSKSIGCPARAASCALASVEARVGRVERELVGRRKDVTETWLCTVTACGVAAAAHAAIASRTRPAEGALHFAAAFRSMRWTRSPCVNCMSSRCRPSLVRQAAVVRSMGLSRTSPGRCASSTARNRNAVRPVGAPRLVEARQADERSLCPRRARHRVTIARVGREHGHRERVLRAAGDVAGVHARRAVPRGRRPGPSVARRPRDGSCCRR